MSLAEVYCPIPDNFNIMWTNETRELSVEAIPVCGGVEVGEVAEAGLRQWQILSNLAEVWFTSM